MRFNTHLEWEVLDAEADEWAEVTMQVMSAERSPSRRQRLFFILAELALFAVLASLIGYQLWYEAEAGLAATADHIGALVEVEALSQSSRQPAGQIAAHVRSVALKGGTAMVSVVVTETSPIGHVLPHVETRFYRRCPAGWQRTEPILAFWGRKATIETATLHFDFFELDRPFVEQVAEPIDTFHFALRKLLNLPELSAGERITIDVTPSYVPPGKTRPDSSIVEPSPLLYFVALDSNDKGSPYADAETRFYLRLRSQLIDRSMMESRIAHDVRQEWISLFRQINRWLYDHAADLPSLVDGEPLRDEGIIVEPAHAIAVLTGRDMCTGCAIGDANNSGQSITFSTHALLDFLIAYRGPGAISALLATLGKQENWPGVIDAAFGLSMEELQAEWEAYLQEHRSAGSSPHSLAPILPPTHNALSTVSCAEVEPVALG